MRGGLAVDRGADHLDPVREPAQEHVGPARRAVIHRQEGAPDAGVHGEEALVSPPEAILSEDLAYTAQVEAGVLPLYHADVLV